LYFLKRTQIVFPIPFILEIFLKANKLTAQSSSLVQNTLRDGDEFNWILTHKDTEDIKESWFQPGDMKEVRRIIEDCDPRIAAAVKKTKECLDWKICYRDPIPSWVSRSHKIALLGDSCHPHLPTSAQGASQATESAAVLALCLKLAGKENIPLAVSYSNNGK
jgi:salicylate hydroxylase